MELSSSLRLLCFASLLLLCSALLPPQRGTSPALSDEALTARVCHPHGAHPAMPLSWCHELHLRRHRRHRPAPPPGRDGEEEIDTRYGVTKRLVPSGPNPLHN